ncbi:hypothetical protein CTAYLR_003496 [Chrysophaeum taylorii]|uniref:Uncharacterized protein n=1 Tax=Chrysophaeum taylorii TaxID=2483200 RepID=A0AAD7UCW7_9STRA|nr:hypothetical protein CTAYLR_003496 [Chrysophaeum taylorii]
MAAAAAQVVVSTTTTTPRCVRSPAAQSLMPYCDVMRRVEEVSGIGKKGDAWRELDGNRMVVRARGNCGVANWARFPRIGDLGLEMRYVFVQYRVDGARAGMDLELGRRRTQEKFRISLSTRVKNPDPTVVGGALRGTLPGGPGWVMLAVDLDRCCARMGRSPEKTALRAVTARAEISVRGVWTARADYSVDPREAPKQMQDEDCVWVRFFPSEEEEEEEEAAPPREPPKRVDVAKAAPKVAAPPADEEEEESWFRLGARIGPCTILAWPFYAAGNAVCSTDGRVLSRQNARISALATRGSAAVVATYEKSATLWSFKQNELRWLCDWQPHEQLTSSLEFSEDASLLASTGLDSRKRHQICVWEVRRLQTQIVRIPRVPPVALVARQLLDLDVVRARWSVFEPRSALVSCGRENARFLRVDGRGHLPGAPAALQEYARGTTFVDVAFAAQVVLVASSKGTLLQLSYVDRSLLCVLRLHAAGISRVVATTEYVATASRDGLVRLWPLDFSDYLMEAEHESPVIDVALDGRKKTLLCATASTLGSLDVETRSYSTLARNHVGPIRDISISDNHKLVASCGEDGTIRVWEYGGAQTVELLSADEDKAGRVCWAGDDVLAVGFDSGSIRVFGDGDLNEIATTCQHAGAVSRLFFDEFLYSAGTDGYLVRYDERWLVADSVHVDVARPAKPQLRQQVDAAKAGDLVAALTSRDPASAALFDARLSRLRAIRVGEPLVDVGFENASVLWLSAASGVRYRFESGVRLETFAAAAGPVAPQDSSSLSSSAAAAAASSRWAKRAACPVPAAPDLVALAPGLVATADGQIVRVAALDPLHKRKRRRYGVLNHAARVERLVFARGGEGLVSADADGCLYFWQPRDPPRDASAVSLGRIFGKKTLIRDACWVPDCCLVGAIGCRLLRAPAGERLHDEPVLLVAATKASVAAATATKLFEYDASLEFLRKELEIPGVALICAASSSIFAATPSGVLDLDAMATIECDAVAMCARYGGVAVATATSVAIAAKVHDDDDGRRLEWRYSTTLAGASRLASSGDVLAATASNALWLLRGGGEDDDDDDDWVCAAHLAEPVVVALAVVSLDLAVASRSALRLYRIIDGCSLRPAHILRLADDPVALSAAPGLGVVFGRSGTVTFYQTDDDDV